MNKALLVGINKYPSAPLRGCVNDVSDMADYLVKYKGFAPTDIRIVTDERATTQGILERLSWLVDVKPGDCCLFHYSGHGAQIATRDKKAEVDGLHEIICPVDFNWSMQYMITDKQFVKIFSAIPAGVKFYWVSDSCHSGDLDRSLAPKKKGGPLEVAKYIMPPVDLNWRIISANHKKIVNENRAMINNKLDVGFVSGCMSNQTSADTSVNGRPCGALTNYLLRVLKNSAYNKASLNQVVEVTRKNLAKDRYTQKPQAEGARVNLAFLG